MSLYWQISYANGYIELGMYDEALKEINSIPDTDKLKTEVLEAQLNLYSAMKAWGTVIPIARTLAKRNPKNIKWWDIWACATRQVSGYKNASIICAGASAYHPRSAIIKYNLGCYACLDGKLDEAQKLVREAIELDENYGLRALDDVDLRDLWKHLSNKKGITVPSKESLLKEITSAMSGSF
jgi:tetratricopeptide (TPR) repeat protein